jgi:hypothetical protein
MREAMRIGGQGEMLLSNSGQKGEGSGGEQASCSARPAPEEGGLRPPHRKTRPPTEAAFVPNAAFSNKNYSYITCAYPR